MKKIQIEYVNTDEILFHFTDKKNIESIEKIGLKALIGHNSNGIEKNEKVFFSEGMSEMLRLVYNLTRVSRDAIENNKKESTERNKVLENWFSKYSYLQGVQQGNTWNNAYNITYEILKNSKYLKLNLEGISTKEFEKLNEAERDKIDYLIDDIDEETGQVMEKHNMHTRIGRGVSEDKISMLQYENRDDALAVVKYIYGKLYDKVGEETIQQDREMYYMRGLKSFFEYVSNIEKDNDQKKYFEEKEIGKSTINSSTYMKDAAMEQIQNDQKEIKKGQRREREEDGR